MRALRVFGLGVARMFSLRLLDWCGFGLRVSGLRS